MSKRESIFLLLLNDVFVQSQLKKLRSKQFKLTRFVRLRSNVPRLRRRKFSGFVPYSLSSISSRRTLRNLIDRVLLLARLLSRLTRLLQSTRHASPS